MMRAAGLPDREELRKNAGKKGLAEFVKSAEFSEPTNPELVRGGIAVPAVEEPEDAEEIPDDDSIDAEEPEDADEPEKPADNYLTSKHVLPPWFSDEPVTNDMIWTSVLTGGGVAMLFGLAYLEGDPPKISLAEQIIVVIAFTVLAPFFMFIYSFLRGSDTHREWAGLDTKKSVSYSVKAKKRATAAKPQKTGEAPRKARNKKHRR